MTEEGLIAAVKQMLEDARDKDFVFKPTKFSIGFPSVAALGFNVNFEGVFPDSARIQAILKYKRPASPNHMFNL
jgi:hypothetical protein